MSDDARQQLAQVKIKPEPEPMIGEWSETPPGKRTIQVKNKGLMRVELPHLFFYRVRIPMLDSLGLRYVALNSAYSFASDEPLSLTAKLYLSPFSNLGSMSHVATNGHLCMDNNMHRAMATREDLTAADVFFMTEFKVIPKTPEAFMRMLPYKPAGKHITVGELIDKYKYNRKIIMHGPWGTIEKERAR